MIDGQGELPFGDRAAAADGLDDFRNDVLTELPALLQRALAGYGRFAGGMPPADTKGFIAYQTACRAALSHIHLLVKLAHWARPGVIDSGPAATDADQLDRLVREAEAALADEPADAED